MRLRLILALALLFLSGLTMRYPIFEAFELAEHEGERIPLYYLKVVEEKGGVYYVEARFTGERIRVLSSGDFSPGDVVSFYGVVRDGILVNEEYHLHPYPNSIYYLSAMGLVFFIVLFLRKWRFSFREMRFREA